MRRDSVTVDGQSTRTFVVTESASGEMLRLVGHIKVGVGGKQRHFGAQQIYCEPLGTGLQVLGFSAQRLENAFGDAD
ncbi:MAG: hypothetical protein ACI9MR_002107 [Myxococcota bacterium]|jgi:hypothetical protein